MTYNAAEHDMKKSANRVFEMLKLGLIRGNIGKEYLLSDVVEVHNALENRKTKGSIVLKNNY